MDMRSMARLSSPFSSLEIAFLAKRQAAVTGEPGVLAETCAVIRGDCGGG